MSCFDFIPSSFSLYCLNFSHKAKYKVTKTSNKEKNQIAKDKSQENWARNGLTLNINYVCNKGHDILYCSNTPNKTHIEIMHVICVTIVMATSFVTICLTVTMTI
jgi:hypothetical protein